MITEDQLEQQCLGWFREGGWETVFGPDIAHDGTAPACPSRTWTFASNISMSSNMATNPRTMTMAMLTMMMSITTITMMPLE